MWVSPIYHPRRDFMTSLTTKLLLIGGMAVGAAGAAAAADNDVNTAVVRYSTVDLATDSGVHTLYRRIEPAGSRLPNEAVIRCRKEAVAGAVEKIHNQRLAALDAAGKKSG